MAAPLFLQGPAATPAFSVSAPAPAGDAARLSLLKIVFQGDVAMAALDQNDRDHLDAKQYAFPKERKEPIENAKHVRNAIARFNQVKGVSDAERDEAWDRIQAAARTFGVKVEERSWRELNKPPR